MIKKTLFYSCIFVLSLLCFLVATAPASLLWERVLEPRLRNNLSTLNISSVQGTIWAGKAQVNYYEFPFIVGWTVGWTVDWGMSLDHLFSLTVPVSLDIQSQAGSVHLLAEPGINNSFLTLTKANIDLSQLTSLVKRRGVVLDGKLAVKDLRFSFRDRKIVSLTGLASWSGGDITYPAGRAAHERTLPAFKAKATTNELGKIHIGIRDTQAAFDVIDVTLGTQGEAILKVARRLLDLSDEAWPKNSKESDIIFKVKKVIY